MARSENASGVFGEARPDDLAHFIVLRATKRRPLVQGPHCSVMLYRCTARQTVQLSHPNRPTPGCSPENPSEKKLRLSTAGQELIERKEGQSLSDFAPNHRLGELDQRGLREI